ncbi:uncharacterized protein LOC123878583 [Maniola jurtina]|uniref:uncharacterized protein LOC123878583 n=1 Tax=Maniola jurtina TaxID=191418 RepID=UPI001E68F2F6|nr:uncharacterized protein LOC123878583 [Maniola jurtina]
MNTIEEIDIDYLITLIQEREIIWDKSNVDFKNKNLKTKAWEDISKVLFPDYENFTAERKNKVGNDLIKKWRSVKDNYFRYSKKLKETSKSGSGATKLKKYHLYNQLLFLRKVEQNATESSLDSPREINNESTSTNDDITTDNTPRYVPVARKRAMQMDEFEREGLKLLKEPENRHMSFFRAILPSIQEFSDRETLRFQSKVIQIIDEMRYGQTSSYVSGPSTSHQPPYGYQTANFQSTYISDFNNSITSPETSQASEETEYDFSNL